MSKQFWGIIAVIVLIFVGIAAFSGGGKQDKGKANQSALTGHVEGKGTTGVTLVEWGDYQCPFCGDYYPILKQVLADYGDKIKFQFRNFPLTSIHPNAFAGARAAEAAGLQNKYWEMHDLLYENQQQWSEGSSPNQFFDQYAKQIGLDLTRFRDDFQSTKVNDAINADLAEGNKLKITGTPTFYLDGKQVQIDQSVDAFKKVIDAEIAQKAPASKSSSTKQ